MDHGKLEHHMASPNRTAMGLSLVGLVRDVASRHMEPVGVVESGLQHATSWPQHCQLRRDRMWGGIALHWHRQLLARKTLSLPCS